MTGTLRIALLAAVALTAGPAGRFGYGQKEGDLLSRVARGEEVLSRLHADSPETRP
jgi:hypothetical protein